MTNSKKSLIIKYDNHSLLGPLSLCSPFFISTKYWTQASQIGFGRAGTFGPMNNVFKSAEMKKLIAFIHFFERVGMGMGMGTTVAYGVMPL